jgi:hypothetical protein
MEGRGDIYVASFAGGLMDGRSSDSSLKISCTYTSITCLAVFVLS